MKIEIPNSADLPAALVKLMGWEILNGHDPLYAVYIMNGEGRCLVSKWSPLTNRNHSRLAVEECARLLLGREYIRHLGDQIMEFNPGNPPSARTDPWRIANAPPAWESRASFITLSEYHQKKGTM